MIQGGKDITVFMLASAIITSDFRIPYHSILRNNTTLTYSMKASLWLYPPTNSRQMLREQIAHLAHLTPLGSGPFEPHITLVGNIDVESDDEALEICQNLRDLLEGRYRNGIVCQFEEDIVSMQNTDGEFVWNQAFVLALKQTVSLNGIKEDVCAAFGIDPTYPPPICKPHLSLFYGKYQVPPTDAVVPPCDFIATTLGLWSCLPASVEGVREWREIGSEIDLLA